MIPLIAIQKSVTLITLPCETLCIWSKVSDKVEFILTLNVLDVSRKEILNRGRKVSFNSNFFSSFKTMMPPGTVISFF